MQALDKLQEYYDRMSEIAGIEEMLKRKIALHNEKTKRDFGVCQGEVLSVDTMVSIIAKLDSFIELHVPEVVS